MPLAALLAPVTDVSGAEGTVTVQAQVTGTSAEPSVRGEGSLTGGRIALRGLPTPLRDITARVVATPGSIRLVDATAALGAGTFGRRARPRCRGGRSASTGCGSPARDVPLRPLEGLDTLWNADLELGGAEGRVPPVGRGAPRARHLLARPRHPVGAHRAGARRRRAGRAGFPSASGQPRRQPPGPHLDGAHARGRHPQHPRDDGGARSSSAYSRRGTAPSFCAASATSSSARWSASRIPGASTPCSTSPPPRASATTT